MLQGKLIFLNKKFSNASQTDYFHIDENAYFICQKILQKNKGWLVIKKKINIEKLTNLEISFSMAVELLDELPT